MCNNFKNEDIIADEELTKWTNGFEKIENYKPEVIKDFFEKKWSIEDVEIFGNMAKKVGELSGKSCEETSKLLKDALMILNKDNLDKLP